MALYATFITISTGACHMDMDMDMGMDMGMLHAHVHAMHMHMHVHTLHAHGVHVDVLPSLSWCATTLVHSQSGWAMSPYQMRPSATWCSSSSSSCRGSPSLLR